MIRIKINGKDTEVRPEHTIMQAADKAGISIPAMCHNEGLEHFTSCMLCVVKDKMSGKLIPSCSFKVAEGMDIITDDDEIREARQMALELLLSDHVGDCEAPCQISCPAHMDIPLMNRLLAEGKTTEALRVVMQDIALPSVLGRICPAPCEGACRRKTVDEPVSICLLKRYAGDAPAVRPMDTVTTLNGKRVAVIGAGPAGLSAAYYLRLRGYAVMVIDSNEMPGGALQYKVPDEKLEKDVLQNEILFIRNSGVDFMQNTTVDAVKFNELREDYDALVVATGDIQDEIKGWGLEHNDKQLLADKNTYETSLKGVFSVGNVNRSAKLAIRSLGQGKEAAFSIDQYLSGKQISGEPRMFNSRFGKLVQEEFVEFLKESTEDKRFDPVQGLKEGFSQDEVMREAARCLHCDCRKITDCKLRIYADQYKANQKRFIYEERNRVTKQFQHDAVVYEPEKCIKCGICVRVTAKYREELGLTFIGRGFDVKVGVPFGNGLDKGLQKAAIEAADACPTGALSKK